MVVLLLERRALVANGKADKAELLHACISELPSAETGKTPICVSLPVNSCAIRDL